MSDATDRGITVTEIAAMDLPIDVNPETTAAFVGRALRGPIDIPVPVRNFGDFRRRFGDVWSRSSLGPAVRQFFEHGGRQLYVVRVANNARGALIRLAAGDSALGLRALEPGSTERIRAAVDYDGIADGDPLFNLTLQRLDPATGLVADQEMYRKLSHEPAAATFVGDVLLHSSLARVEEPYPSHRPDVTTPRDQQPGSTWVEAMERGSDGTGLCDYDLVGSLRDGRGMFALEQVDHFDLLYLPPPGKGVDVGPAAMLAAERYCRRRGAMLIVDPSVKWTTPGQALAGVRAQGYASRCILSYFPRLVLRDDDDRMPRAAGGALAGLLCKLDRGHGPWGDLDAQGLGFARDLRPAMHVDDETAQLLIRDGLNVIRPGPARRSRVHGSTTLGQGTDVYRRFGSLGVQRLCLRITSAIDQATRWAVFEQPDERLARHLRSRIFSYLSALFDLGAFADDRIVVQCDAGLCKRNDSAAHGISILVAFRPHGCARPISLTLHQSARGYRATRTAFPPTIQDCA